MDNYSSNDITFSGSFSSSSVSFGGNCSAGGSIPPEPIPTLVDYQSQVINKPSINNTVLTGNYDEIDPTVPKYVKDGKALNSDDEISFEEIKQIWDTIVRGGES